MKQQINSRKSTARKLEEWFDLVAGYDPQTYQDLKWNWEERISDFIADEDRALHEVEEMFETEGDYLNER